MLKKKFEICLAFNTPRPPMSVHKKIQLNRSSSLAGYEQHIYKYMNVLFLKEESIPNINLCFLKRNLFKEVLFYILHNKWYP